jgi:hypothetical protein
MRPIAHSPSLPAGGHLSNEAPPSRATDKRHAMGIPPTFGTRESSFRKRQLTQSTDERLADEVIDQNREFDLGWLPDKFPTQRNREFLQA